MGCLFCNPSKEIEEEAPKPKEYSWDKKPKIDPNDFTLQNVNGEDIVRVAGSVNGQQLVIQNCCNNMIFVLDHIDSINIDDCANCKIVLGPVKGSVFVRDCLDCVLIVPCGQFRMRDSHRLDVFLHCATQPIIESSTHVRFACIRLQYDKLKDHMKNAGLSPFNNLWRSVHDFTPSDGDGNWRVLSPKVRLQEYITPPFPPQLREVGWTVSGDSKVIPISLGLSEFEGWNICLVLVFKIGQDEQTDVALNFLENLFSANNQCSLLTSREVQLQTVDASAMDLGSELTEKLESGPVIGLIIGGEGSNQCCLKVKETLELHTELWISSDSSIARKQASSFYQCAAMHLGC